MRILYLSQYFPPEIGATQTRALEMAKGLVAAGHQVTMLCEVPNHPAGIIQPGYRRKLWVRETLDGIEVIRVWVRATPVKTFYSRMAFYLSYMAMATWAGLLLARGRYDAIYCTSPPLFVGGAGLMLSKLRRIPLIFEVRDLWPESAVQMGELANPRAIRIATRLEETCYRHAQHIVAVTQGIRQRLLDRGVPPSKVTTIPNGANTDLYIPQPPNQVLRRRWNISEDQFVVIYTGLHGLVHGLETALQAADRLHDHPDILFLLVGDGPQKPVLVNMARDMNLSNVHFHDAVPEVDLPATIGLADVGLHTSRRLPISQGALPVKMFSYMACERPVLLSIEGEAVDVLEVAQAGVAVPPEDPDALAQAILSLQADPASRQRYARNGRAFVEAHYSRQAQANQLEKLLRSIVHD